MSATLKGGKLRAFCSIGDVRDEVLRHAFMGARLERGEWGSQDRERLLELYDR